MQSQKIILQEMGGRKSEKKMHLKVVKCLATLCLAIGIFGICGLNVHAESAALKKGSNTAAVNISKDGWTITAAFRKATALIL